MHRAITPAPHSSPATFRDLRVWQEGMKLAGDVYGLARLLPADERFGLAPQLRRAAVSVVSNIAEGYARRRCVGEARELRRYLLMSFGSLAELETQIRLAEQERLFANGASGPALNRLDSVGRMLNAMIRSLAVP